VRSESAGELNQTPVERHRLFVALHLVAWLLPPLERLQAEWRQRPGGRAVRWTRVGQIHLTLRFLGSVEVDRIAEGSRLLEQACRGHQPFLLRLRGTGCFPSVGPPRVVWVGIEGAVDALRGLQESVGEALAGLGDHVEAKTFRPHLTMGRVRSGARGVMGLRAAVQERSAQDLGEWPVNHVVLLRSELRPEGAHYSPLATVCLSEPDSGGSGAKGSR
jgi:RNA 2',3'-cyclic 3'-phosphodiesterase